jgi:hypothetical protein
VLWVGAGAGEGGFEGLPTLEFEQEPCWNCVFI